uniref:Uncharacterized protein n=1 Tax=Anguilla anguilla TaxID=7936 RepID=A0A0E9SQQ1_ANGAN
MVTENTIYGYLDILSLYFYLDSIIIKYNV